MEHPVFLERSAEESLDAAPYKLRRRNSETMRAQYINTKELRICIGTYNAAGIEPPEGLDIAEWLGTTGGGQADMYVLSFQDDRPALAWEALIRDMLTRTQPSCSRPNYCFPVHPEEYVVATPRMLGAMEDEQPRAQQRALLKTMSKTDRIGLAWPEQPLDLMVTASLSSALFKSPRSFGAHRSFMKSRVAADDCPAMVPDLDPDLDGEARVVMARRRAAAGRRSRVQNIKVSAVGVGAMGYIGDKGSVSATASMFCFVCTHLSAGERPGNLLKRNADVQEIHRRTRFGGLELSRDIYEHEHVLPQEDFLAGRSELPDRRAVRQNPQPDRRHGLASASRERSAEAGDEEGAGVRRVGRGSAVLEFAPTYKYEIGTGKYTSDDQKGGRRTPAWCCRSGRRRSELTLSDDHKPVTATYAAEVEVELLCGRKMQRALTLMDGRDGTWSCRTSIFQKFRS
ncbi:unnamed protein product [Triticum turgidum subsp. durum]|uniref:Inositol polyphosphate-related phosphatase domain-containing protein n=1 Tax=Triticum turgidum subsp. durum TaxID=4567 RepID=A0A9R1QA09_TRITD|nr:unnamed protein product [Triticum turgidum subsp. durum]